MCVLIFFVGTIVSTVSRASKSSQMGGASGTGYGNQTVVWTTEQKWDMLDPWFLSPNPSITFKEEPCKGGAMSVLGISQNVLKIS